MPVLPFRLRDTLLRHLDRADARWGRRRLYLWRSADRATYRRIQALGQRPILIGGCGRSGTNLLLAVLACHPQVHSLQRETHAFCPTGYEAQIDLEADFLVQHLYRRLIDEPHRPTEIRWCEKTPKNVHFARRALAYLGAGTRFLHIVRDGRDVVTSVHRRARDRAWVPPERWIADAAAGATLTDHPQVLTLRYEDLVERYEATLRGVCEFLDLPFDPAFHDYPESCPFPRDAHWKTRMRPVTTASIGRWKQPEHRAAAAALLALPRAEELLRHYGYEV